MLNTKLPITYLEFIKQLIAPLLAIVYVTTLILHFKNFVDSFGLQMFIIIIFILLLLWMIYVWISKVETEIYPKKNKYKFNSIVRYGSILAVLIACFPSYLIYNSDQIPNIYFTIENDSPNNINLNYFNDYYVKTRGTTGFFYVITNGVITIWPSIDDNKEPLLVEAKSSKVFRGIFENKNKIKNYIEDGDMFISLRITRNNGKSISSENMLHFTREALNSNILTLTLSD